MPNKNFTPRKEKIKIVVKLPKRVFSYKYLTGVHNEEKRDKILQRNPLIAELVKRNTVESRQLLRCLMVGDFSRIDEAIMEAKQAA